jgi:hypothetical protein
MLLPSRSVAQPQQQDNALPIPRLLTITPSGGKAGSNIEMVFTGQDVEAPEALLFSHPGIKAELIPPPPPPPPDPKKPGTQPEPKKPGTKPAAPKFKVTIDPDCPLGIHDVRLINKWGISNARAFVIGELNEAVEKEPNNDVPQAERLELNTTVNGVIAAPTDVDYFVFAGKAGQRVLASVLASSVDSRLHPAVEIYDGAGKPLAFNRRYQGNDALADCRLPTDGDYYVRLYEFTHTQGSPEHFYRLTVTTAPWIDAIYPPVVEPGKTATLTVYGRNLPDGQPDPAAVLDGRVLERAAVTVEARNDPVTSQRLRYGGQVTPPMAGLDGIEYRLRNASGTSNPYFLPFAKAPVVLDNQANDAPNAAQVVSVPCEIAGRIEKRRDRDWYAFAAKKGETYLIEVLCERLGAPADLHVLLRSPDTKQNLADLDDNADTLTPIRFFTRTDDPPAYRFSVPADGQYQLLVASRDADTRAGPRLLYCVRIAAERPDFRLIVMPPAERRPDSGCILQGGNENLTVLVWRQDGWNGEVVVSAEGLPEGVTCPPQTVGIGLKQTALVLSAAADAQPWTGEIRVVGTGVVRGQTVVREARPASITWPTQPQPNIPNVARLDRNLVLAVREKAPFHLSAAAEQTAVRQGTKVKLALKLARLWPEFKAPLQVGVVDPIPNITFNNNNQPLTIAADKTEASAVLDVRTNAPPGTYNIVLRGQAQIPFNKDPMAKQKPNVNVLQPAVPITLRVYPQSVASVSVNNPNTTVKAGAQAEIVVKVARLHNFAGGFKVQLVLPEKVTGVRAEEVSIPPGADEAKLVLSADPDAMPGNRQNLVVRAVALQDGTVTTVQEAKINVAIVK